MDLNKLREKMPFVWKVQGKAKTGKTGKTICVAYIDARAVQKFLDNVVGPENWKTEFSQPYFAKTVANRYKNGATVEIEADIVRVSCKLSIKVNDEWITKEDVGEGEDTEATKSAFSDAFKRSAVHWGVGRFLYDLGIQNVSAEELKECKYNLTNYLNNRLENNSTNGKETKQEEGSLDDL